MVDFDLIVIGGGPGGYVAAIRAAQLGQKVALIEREELGGVCMNWGCIPTKFLLHQTGLLHQIEKNKYLVSSSTNQGLKLDWTKLKQGRQKIVQQLVKGVEFLLNRNSIEVIKGEARLTSEGQVKITQEEGPSRLLKAKNILLATGSRPAQLPFLIPDGQKIITSRQLLDIDKIPEKLVVIGAGVIGLEMGTIFSRLGAKVVVIELLPSILPGAEESLTRRLSRILSRQGLDILTQMKVEKASLNGQNVVLEGYCSRTSKSFKEEGEKVLLAIGRKPNTEVLGEAAPKFKLSNGGFLQVNQYFQTTLPQVWAIGDLIGGKLLAHKASHQGIVAVENMAGKKQTFDENLVPLAVFTEPELASVGLTEKEVVEKGISYSLGQFPLRANGRAVTMDEVDGQVRILVDKEGCLLGAHLLAPHASEMITELVLAMKERVKVTEIGESIHIHPTLAESIMEAALNAAGRAIHTINK